MSGSSNRRNILILLVACTFGLWAGAGSAAADDCNSNGVPDDQETFGVGARLYVHATAVGTNDGSSWTDALTELEYALCMAENDPNFTEVWVAEGTYVPLRQTDLGDARTATFTLLNGVNLYGGFDGTETTIEERAGLFDQTVLSGDLNGDDDGWSNRGDNSYHVVTAGGLNVSALIDGFTITGGYANSVGPNERGAGVYVEHGSPTIRNCRVYRNRAIYMGAGVFVRWSNAQIEHSEFDENWCDGFGGGLAFSWAGTGPPLVSNCAFSGNRANDGGGLSIDSWGVDLGVVANCLFAGNHVDRHGAAVYAMYNSNWTIVNCTMAGNHTTETGATYVFEAHPVLVNSAIWGNTGDTQSGEAAQVFLDTNAYIDVDYSCLEGWTGSLGGAGNFDADPLFVQNPDDGGDGWNIGDANDDYGDLHLQDGSPCVNVGDNAAAGLPAEDVDGDQRVQQCRVDVGADETPYYRDCNDNGVADACDIDTSGDCNTNGVPDDCDVDPSDPDGDGEVSPDANGNGIPDECESIQTWYVDDDAPADPGPGDPSVSDPLEDGTANHPFDAIQEAINAASASDTVLVLDGTYTGTGNRDIDYTGKAITVRSHNGPQNCVVDCESAGRGFDFGSGEDGDSVLSGFTIVNGFAVNFGGGILSLYSSPAIVNCRILGCRVEYDEFPIANGGGIFCAGGTATFINCLVAANSAAGLGGAVACDSSGNASFVNCTLTGNQSGYGEAVYVQDSDITLDNGVVWGNTGGAVHVSSGSATIAYSDIEGGWTGAGNIDADPAFVDIDGADDDPDTWGDNDYRLSDVSPCIDAADNTNVPPDVADLDEDGDITERHPLDLDLLPRFMEHTYRPDTGVSDPPPYPAIVDMGAYERVSNPASLLVGGVDGNSVVWKDGKFGAVTQFVDSHGPMVRPTGVVFGPDGHLYVASSLSDSIVRYDGETGAWMGVFVQAGDGGLDSPLNLVFGTDGHLYVISSVTDNILRFDGQTGAFLGEFIPAGSGGLGDPAALTFGPDGNLYVCSGATDEVLRYDATDGAFIDTFVTAGAGGLDGPFGLAFGGDGYLYVSSLSTDQVLRYDAATGAFADVAAAIPTPQDIILGPDAALYVSTWSTQEVYRLGSGVFVPAGSGGMSDPKGLAFDGNGDLLVASRLTEQILQYDGTNGAFIGAFAGGGSGGLIRPRGVTYGPDANLYVSSDVTDEVLRYDGYTGVFIDVFASAGSGGLDAPRGLAFGPDDDLYVASRITASILRYDGQTGACLGEFVASGAGGMVSPQDLVFHTDGYLYVSDYQTHSVHRFDGQTGAFVDDFIAPGSGGLSQPIGLTIGPDGHWYVADYGNDNVLRFDGTDGSFIDEFVSAGDGGLDGASGVLFDEHGNLYVSSFATDTVLRYYGATGQFIDEFIAAGSAGLDDPQRMVWMADFGEPGDYDDDGDVDLDDFAGWGGCMTGPDAGPYDPPCRPFDLDHDSDVDMVDFAAFQRVFGRF